MRIGSLLVVLLVLLALHAPAHAWRYPPLAPSPPAASPTADAARPSTAVMPAVQPGPPVQVAPPSAAPPALAERPGPTKEQAPATVGDFPSYPYPAFHNPFYQGPSTRNVLSEAVDWIRDLPSNAAGTVRGIWERSPFPRAPATHGASQKPQATPPDAGTRISTPPVPDPTPSGAVPSSR
jgi:hypothetical protein